MSIAGSARFPEAISLPPECSLAPAPLYHYGFRLFAGREVRAIGMVEDQCADAGFRVHHHAFSQPHANIFGPEQLPDSLLVVQVGASRIAEAVALAAIARREAFLHSHGGRIGESPIFADAAMQPFGAAFGRLDGQRLQSVRFEV